MNDDETIGEIWSENAIFDCPLCGVHVEGPLTYWAGRRPLGIVKGMSLSTVVFTTTACGDEFPQGAFDIRWLTFSDPAKPSVFTVRPWCNGL